MDPIKMASQKTTTSIASGSTPGPSRRYYWMNMAGLSLGIILLCIGYTSFFYLMTSLHSKSGIGSTALAVDYVTQVLTCFFLPPLLLRVIGCKWTLVASGVTIAIFIATNLKSSFETLIPGAVVLGIGFSTLNATMNSVTSDLAVGYAKLIKMPEKPILERFFAVISGCYSMASVWANVLSSQILSPQHVAADNVSTSRYVCGAQYCNVDELMKTDFNSSLQHIPDSTVPQREIYNLAGACLGFVALGIIVILAMLNSYSNNKVQDTTESSVDRALATIRLLRDPNMLLLIVITMCGGLMSSFMAADFTKGFVTCTIGIHNVGLVLTCLMVIVCVGNFLSGFVAKYLPRVVLFLAALTLMIADFLVMLFWIPDPQFPVMLYVIVTVWGLTFMVWIPQLCALYAEVFPGKYQEAFSNHRTWECVGFALGFTWSHYLCMTTKIYLLMGFLIIGIMGYLVVEKRLRNKQKTEANLAPVKPNEGITSDC